MKQISKLHKTNICEEEPVEFYLNSKHITTFMCTLQELRELAIGHLFSRGIIKNPLELATLAACEDMRKIYASLDNNKNIDGLDLGTLLTSNCGGAKFNDHLEEIRTISSDFQISILKIRHLMADMHANATMYKTIGGMHCAAVASKDSIITLSEDVGRHNAVDKVLGKTLFMEMDFTQSMILTTGRISSDMILKAANASCPCIISRSIATTLALELAEKLGITVIGRALSSTPIVYNNKERIAS